MPSNEAPKDSFQFRPLAWIRMPFTLLRGITPRGSTDKLLALLSLTVSVIAALYALVDDQVTSRFSPDYRIVFALVVGLLFLLSIFSIFRGRDRRGSALKRETEKFRLTLLLQRAYLEPNSPLLGFMAGWINRVLDEFQIWKPTVVTVDGSYWKSCVRYLELDDHVKAVSDTSGTIKEQQSIDFNAPITPNVKERIYLHDWVDFFDVNKVTQHVYEARPQAAENASVYLSHAPIRLIENAIRPFDGYSGKLEEFNRVIGWNVFFMKQNIVGGFVWSEDSRRILLHVRQDPGLWEVVVKNYERLRDLSIRINSETTSQEFLAKWLKKNDIGKWIWGKAPVHQRGASYSTKYDGHIRAWIPGYENLVDACADHVKYEIIQHIREMGRQRDREDARVLEIGFGTGALSFKLIEWIGDFNGPLEAASRRMQGRRIYPGVRLRFSAVDSIGDDWIKLIERHEVDRLKKIKIDIRKIFKRGTFGSDLEDLPYPSYDIICSSLVLHDLVKKPSKDEFTKFLITLGRLLRPGGRVVMGDVFTAGDEARRLWWKDWMRDNALTTEAIEKFFEYNDDMFNTFKKSDIKQWALELGCQADVYNPHPSDDPMRNSSPLGVLVIHFGQDGLPESLETLGLTKVIESPQENRD